MIKMSICTAQIKIKMDPVFDSTHAPPTPSWQSTVKTVVASSVIKRSRSKNGPDQISIPVAGVSIVGTAIA